MPRKKDIIRTTPFEELARVEDGVMTYYGITREENADWLAWEAQDIRKRKYPPEKLAKKLATANEIEAWLPIKAGDVATNAIRTAICRYVELLDETLRADTLGSPTYSPEQTFDYLCDLDAIVSGVLYDSDWIRGEDVVHKTFEQKREESLALMRKLAKTTRWVVFKDYLTWFKSTLSHVQRSGDGFAFDVDPAPYLAGEHEDILILFA